MELHRVTGQRHSSGSTRKGSEHGCNSILERWLKDDKYRTSQMAIGRTEDIVQTDELALTDSTYNATKFERERSEQHCVAVRVPDGRTPQLQKLRSPRISDSTSRM